MGIKGRIEESIDSLRGVAIYIECQPQLNEQEGIKCEQRGKIQE